MIVVDNKELREPNLLTSKKKPVGNVNIDLDNPLATGLTNLWLFNRALTVVDIVTGITNDIEVTNRKLGHTDRGEFFYWDSHNINNMIKVPQVTTPSTSHTFEWIAWYPQFYYDMAFTGSDSVYYFDIQTGRTVIGHNAGASISFYDGAWTDTGYEPNNKGTQHIVLSLNGDTGIATLIVNGEVEYTGATYTGAAFTSSDGTLFSRYAGNGNYYAPKGLELFKFSMYEKALSVDEARSLFVNPYQILKPA